MKSKFTCAALLLALTTPVISAHAQFEKVPSFVKQIEIGYGYSFCTADYIIKSKAELSTRPIDTTTTMHTQTKGGITDIFGTSLKLKRLGMKSALSLGIDLVYSGYIWDFH